MFEPADSLVEHERFRVKQLIKQSIIKILADGNASGEFMLENLNTTALCVVGAMTFVVVEPLDPAQNTKFDQLTQRLFFSRLLIFVWMP